MKWINSFKKKYKLQNLTQEEIDILGVDSGDGCMTIYLMPLNCILKNDFKRAIYDMCVLSQ